MLPPPSARLHPRLIQHTPTSAASIFGFKGSESARRTEGYALVLVIAQRASVINNKGLWRTQGLWDASLVHATQVKDKTVISIPKMWPLQLQLHLNNSNRVRARRCDASLLARHERLIDIADRAHATQHVHFLNQFPIYSNGKINEYWNSICFLLRCQPTELVTHFSCSNRVILLTLKTHTKWELHYKLFLKWVAHSHCWISKHLYNLMTFCCCFHGEQEVGLSSRLAHPSLCPLCHARIVLL